MKQQDIAILIAIIIVAGAISFFISGKFVNPADQKLKSEVVSKISPEFTPPTDKYFNNESINPTVKIKVGPNDNLQPFSNQ